MPGPIAVMTTAAFAACLTTASASPTTSVSLERLATKSSSDSALAAEARLRRLETRALGPGHAAEHAAARAQIRRVTTHRRRAGLRPLPPRSSRRRGGQRATALGDPSQVGRWGSATSLPVVAVHAILLPTGKLMLVQQDDIGGVAYIYDPVTGQGNRADPPANIWCGGQVYLADGRLLFIGGTLQHNSGDNYSGLNRLYTFDPLTEQWQRQVDMRRGRWYPTGTRLPDGRVLITAGWDESGTMTTNGDVEIYTPGGAAGSIQLVGDRQLQFYPHWSVLPDGRAFVGGPGRSNSAFLDLSSYAFADAPTLPESKVGYGGGVLLPGPPSGSRAVFLAGGGSSPGTFRFDTLNPSAGWTSAAPLPETRRNLNTVLLPDGALLAVGGNGSGNEALPQRETLLYSPAENSWRRLAEQSEQRAYHSTALLLPDGRVWSGGDNTASGGGNTGDIVEIFEPPYLFKGPRPSIVSAPSQSAYGASFAIGADGSPTRAVLISPGATTHGNDMNQRHVELAVTPTAGGLSALAPPNANLAPPGDYMLFVLDSQGVPSVARWVRLGGAAPAPNQAPTAAFTQAPASPQIGQQVTFTDASTDSGGAIASRAWDLDDDGAFDDGTGATAARSFSAAGTYTVRLRVTDDDGAPATTSGQVTVSDGLPPPPPPPPPPGNLVANPSFESTTAGWTGFQGTLAREAQAGAPAGGFVARVTRTGGTYFTIDGGNNVASTGDGTTYTATAWVKAASASSIGKPIQIKLRERTPANVVVADVGSASVALTSAWQQLTVARTTAPGDRLGVRLSQSGAVAGDAYHADSFRLTAGGGEPPGNDPPSAAFTVAPGSPQAGQQVTFTDESTDPDGRIAARAWDLDGDGQYDDATGASASRSFAAAGTYTVGLRVTDDDGEPATTSRQVTVSGPPPPNQVPTAAFTQSPASPQTGQQVTFTDASTDGDGVIVSRAWDLDDDGAFDDGTGATAARSFSAAGTYTVRLRVTDDDGAPATTSGQVTVSVSPPPPPGNLVVNPSFETNTSGWVGFQASLAREAQADAPAGGFVARVTRSSGTYFTIDGGNNVASTIAGTYTATAWVKAANASSVGKPIQIKLRERTPGNVVVADVGSANVALTSSWQQLTVTRTAAAGNRLGVRLSQSGAITANAFYADAFRLTAG